MNVCARAECQTTAGCANRGPKGELCVFPVAKPFDEAGKGWSDTYQKLPGWLSVDARPIHAFTDDEIEAEYHRRKLAALTRREQILNAGVGCRPTRTPGPLPADLGRK
jgi:hypothetical protein